MLIGSLVKLHVGLHSCLCFSHLEKLLLIVCFDTSSTPPRYLAVCRASSAFSYRNPDSFSTPSGSIEKAPVSSIASRHLVDRSRSFQPFLICPSTNPRQLHLSTSIMLDTCLATSRSIKILLHALFFTCFAYFLLSLCPQHLVFLFFVGLCFLVLLVPFMSVFCLSPSCLLAFYAL